MYLIVDSDNLKYYGKAAETMEQALKLANEKAQGDPSTAYVIYKAEQVVKTKELPVEVTSTVTLNNDQFLALIGDESKKGSDSLISVAEALDSIAYEEID